MTLTQRYCVVVSDTVHAKIFFTEPGADARVRLVEHARFGNPDRAAQGPASPHITTERNTDRRAGPGDPQLVSRRRHGDEIARRFAAEVAERVKAAVESWRGGCVMLAAEPGMLGLLREAVQDALPEGVVLKALAKDYMALSASELAQRLDLR